MENEMKSDLFDLTRLYGYAYGDTDTVKRLLESSFSSIAGEFESLQGAVSEDDDQAWLLHIHTLKGSFSYIGCTFLFDECALIESRGGIPQPEKQQALIKIREYYKGVRESLQRFVETL